MNTPSAVSTGLGLLLLGAGVLAGGPGCADSAPFPDDDDPGVTEGPAPVAIPGLGHVLGEYVLQVRPKQRTAKLVRLKPGTSSRPGFKPQSIDAVSIEQDNNPGTGTPENVELNTTNVSYGAVCPSGNVNSFCGTVVLGSFYTRSLNNVFAQVTSITDVNGATLTGHSSINSDAGPVGWSQPVDASLGLWKYTGVGMPTGAVGTTSTSKFGTRVWEFADPDGQDTNILVRVLASLTYADYTRTTSTATWVDACSAPGSISATPSTLSAAATIPFPFTFYDKAASTLINYNRDGVFTFAGTRPPSPLNTGYPGIPASVKLPDSPQTKSANPGAYVFWDGLNYDSAPSPNGEICTALDPTSSAPQRRFVITWNHMKIFGGSSSGADLNFGAILTEGTDTIDMIYDSMTGSSTAKVAGSTAVVGAVQGKFNGAVVATPFSIAPGATTVPSTGLKYRFTPIP